MFRFCDSPYQSITCLRQRHSGGVSYQHPTRRETIWFLIDQSFSNLLRHWGDKKHTHYCTVRPTHNTKVITQKPYSQGFCLCSRASRHINTIAPTPRSLTLCLTVPCERFLDVCGPLQSTTCPSSQALPLPLYDGRRRFWRCPARPRQMKTTSSTGCSKRGLHEPV